MKRLTITPRENWREELEELGFIWHSPDGAYWDENACYEFTPAQVEQLETATNEVFELFVEAADRIVNSDELLADYGFPDWVNQMIRDAWDKDVPALQYGRFDFGYDGVNPPKVFEFNCDTPTSLYEAAVVQWNWKEDVFPMADQFNSIHDKFIARWKSLKAQLPTDLYFTAFGEETGEEIATTTYLAELAVEAGYTCYPILVSDLGWNEELQRFTDMSEHPIDALYKLYPWEWLVAEEFGQHIPKCADQMLWLEPIYKMLWSNKSILVHLWDMFPNHPNLLPAYYDRRDLTRYVTKPILGREGANVTIFDNGHVKDRSSLSNPEDGQLIYQQLYDLPLTDGGYPIIGSWVVGGESAGIGIREASLITDNKARFIPHIMR